MLDLLGGLAKAINLMQQIVNSLQCRGKLVCIVRGGIFQLLEKPVDCSADFRSIGWIGLFAVSDVERIQGHRRLLGGTFVAK